MYHPLSLRLYNKKASPNSTSNPYHLHSFLLPYPPPQTLSVQMGCGSAHICGSSRPASTASSHLSVAKGAARFLPPFQPMGCRSRSLWLSSSCGRPGFEITPIHVSIDSFHKTSTLNGTSTQSLYTPAGRHTLCLSTRIQPLKP